jgi:predicted Rdx family selenoprotein
MHKHLLSLLLICLLGVLAGYLLLQRESQHPELQSGPFIPQLQQASDAVNQITVVTTNGERIEVVLEDDLWRMSSHGHYPVDTQKLATLIQDVIKARKLQAKTNREEQLYRLGLAKSEQGQPAELSIKSNQDSWDLIVGNKPSTGLGHYLRFADSSQAWLVDQSLSLPLSARDWMRQPILDVSMDEVVSVSRQDSVTWGINRDSADKDFQLQPMSKAQKLIYAGVLDSYVSNVLNLSFEQLVDADAAFWDSLTPVAEFSIVLRDGRHITLALAKEEDAHYAAYSVDSGSPYWQNWFYKVSGFSAGQLLKSAQDFVAGNQRPKDKLPVNPGAE